MKPSFFQSAADLRGWLDRHHRTARELLAGFHRMGASRGITYPEALDEALCFGWIDGVHKRIDGESYSVRFTPRRPGSTWSAVNIARVHELIAQGRMQPSGLSAFGARDEEKTRQSSQQREESKFDSALDALLRVNPKAASFFDAQPPGYRKIVTGWVMSAKTEATRMRRMAHLAECSARGMRIDLLKPNRS